MRPVFTPPSEVAEYRIVRLLGRGAMGQVYLAHDTLLDRPVAIKFIAAEPNSIVRERFLVEARAIARLTHPNVVSVYRVGELAGRPYLVSEYVRGQSLAELAKPVSVEQGLQIGLGLCAGLKAAHASGVLHRDVKPANAILAESGEAKLLDFGLAKLAPGPLRSDADESGPQVEGSDDVVSGDEATLTPEAEAKSRAASTSGRPVDATLSGPVEEGPAENPSSLDEPLAALREPTPVSLTKTGALVGTPRYMAPEIFAGKAATARSDVYSLGALLFELLAGRAPFVEPDLTRLSVAVRLRAAPSLRQFVPEHPQAVALAAVIDRCLSREPEERYADGAELLKALQSVVSTAVAPSASPQAKLPDAVSRPAPTEAPSETEVAHTPARSRLRLVWLAVGAVALGLTVILGVSPTKHGSESRPDLLTGKPAVTPPLDLAPRQDLLPSPDLRRPDDLATVIEKAAVPSREKATSVRRAAGAGTTPKKTNPPASAPVDAAAKPEQHTAPVVSPPIENPATSAPPTSKPPTSDRVEIPIER